jgi:hypothetical protein
MHYLYTIFIYDPMDTKKAYWDSYEEPSHCKKNSWNNYYYHIELIKHNSFPWTISFILIESIFFLDNWSFVIKNSYFTQQKKIVYLRFFQETNCRTRNNKNAIWSMSFSLFDGHWTFQNFFTQKNIYFYYDDTLNSLIS